MQNNPCHTLQLLLLAFTDIGGYKYNGLTGILRAPTGLDMRCLVLGTRHFLLAVFYLLLAICCLLLLAIVVAAAYPQPAGSLANVFPSGGSSTVDEVCIH